MRVLSGLGGSEQGLERVEPALVNGGDGTLGASKSSWRRAQTSERSAERGAPLGPSQLEHYVRSAARAQKFEIFSLLGLIGDQRQERKLERPRQRERAHPGRRDDQIGCGRDVDEVGRVWLPARARGKTLAHCTEADAERIQLPLERRRQRWITEMRVQIDRGELLTRSNTEARARFSAAEPRDSDDRRHDVMACLGAPRALVQRVLHDSPASTAQRRQRSKECAIERGQRARLEVVRDRVP